MQKPQQVFIYPSKSNNRFMQLLRQTLLVITGSVKPFSQLPRVQHLASRSQNVAMYNWIEDTPYGEQFNEFAAFLSFLKCVSIILIVPLFSANRVWIRHNLRPHNDTRSLAYFKVISSLLKLTCQKTVVLEAYAIGDNTQYFQALHPLVKVAENTSLSDTKRDIQYGFYGHIKPYKNLHTLLSDWPLDCPLVIKGKCSNAEYQEKLLNIISTRGLQVDYQNCFLSDEQYNALLANTQVVILPHMNKRLIASGMFYHAISYGCNVLVGDSELGRCKASEHSFAHLLGNFNDIGKLDLLAPNAVLQQASNSYSDERVQASWRKILQD